MEHIEATSLVIPHLSVYRTGDLAGAYGEFAAAHPRSYRASFADYSGFLVTIVFRHEKAEDPAKPAAVFLEKHPDDVLGLDVLHQLAEFQQREGKTKAAGETRQRKQALETRLGLPKDASSPPPSARTRPLLNAERTLSAQAAPPSAPGV
jgi:hypothetical protein